MGGREGGVSRWSTNQTAVTAGKPFTPWP